MVPGRDASDGTELQLSMPSLCVAFKLILCGSHTLLFFNLVLLLGYPVYFVRLSFVETLN